MRETAIEIAESVRQGRAEGGRRPRRGAGGRRRRQRAARRVRPRRRGPGLARQPRRSTPRWRRDGTRARSPACRSGSRTSRTAPACPPRTGRWPSPGGARSTADSVHVARLRAAGAVPIGKTAAPEFGTLNFTRTKVFGTARNPWDTERTPGGSSGGSAAAVAAGLVPAATASDGGGSTRIPAGFCGLVGFKPSYGRIPHPGPTGSETSVFGLLTTTVADSARHLDVVAGPDDRDRYSLPPAAVGYERGRGARCPSRGCGPGGRSTWASPCAIPRCGRSPRRRPGSWPTPPAWCSTTSRSC